MKSQRRYPQGVSSPSRSLWLRIWNADLSRRARPAPVMGEPSGHSFRSEEHTSELQSLTNLVCRLLLEKKKNKAAHQHALGLHDEVGEDLLLTVEVESKSHVGTRRADRVGDARGRARADNTLGCELV